MSVGPVVKTEIDNSELCESVTRFAIRRRTVVLVLYIWSYTFPSVCETDNFTVSRSNSVEYFNIVGTLLDLTGGVLRSIREIHLVSLSINDFLTSIGTANMSKTPKWAWICRLTEQIAWLWRLRLQGYWMLTWKTCSVWNEFGPTISSAETMSTPGSVLELKTLTADRRIMNMSSTHMCALNFFSLKRAVMSISLKSNSFSFSTSPCKTVVTAVPGTYS